MDEEREKEFLKLIGLTGTIFILRFLNEHDSGQYKDLQEYMNTHSLNQRLRTLLQFNLVEHHLLRDEKRKEWYTLTESGGCIVLDSGGCIVLDSYNHRSLKSKLASY
ncbi:MAG: hypothetical protein HXS48_18320 [Theionarchaea archaeon]|nr:hypothetical protein [Theionarchaea archaeon]